MEDFLKKFQPFPSNALKPLPWLTAYFHTRAQLAVSESHFSCDPACTRPGCKNQDILIPVSMIDLMGAARQHHESVLATYRDYYILGLVPTEQTDWMRKVSLRLKKPCAFLKNDLCSIYPVRPLACIIFPEYLVCEDRFEVEAGKAQFKNFLCLKNPLLLSPGRAEIIRRLKEMWERETLISSYYLFDHSHCYIDFSNITKELLAYVNERHADAIPAPDSQGTIPHQVMERFFHKHSAGCPPFDTVNVKISGLDNQEGQAQFLDLLQDDLVMNRLLRSWEDRDLIFKFVKEKLKRSRKSLLPSEYKFF